MIRYGYWIFLCSYDVELKFNYVFQVSYSNYKFCRILRSPDLWSTLPFPISNKISILIAMLHTTIGIDNYVWGITEFYKNVESSLNEMLLKLLLQIYKTYGDQQKHLTKLWKHTESILFESKQSCRLKLLSIFVIHINCLVYRIGFFS